MSVYNRTTYLSLTQAYEFACSYARTLSLKLRRARILLNTLAAIAKGNGWIGANAKKIKNYSTIFFSSSSRDLITGSSNFVNHFYKIFILNFICNWIPGFRLRQGYEMDKQGQPVRHSTQCDGWGMTSEGIILTYNNKFQKDLLTLLLLFTHFPLHSFIIMLDPFGDAKHTGREINDTFERSVTLACVQELKQQLIQQIPGIQVVLTRVAGDHVQPLQNAQFANRFCVDLYLSLGFYHEEKIPNSFAIFYYMQQPQDSLHIFNPLKLYPIAQAHLASFKISREIAQKWVRLLMQKSVNPSFVCQGTFALPCKPLFGVQAPALYIEAGLRKGDDFKYIVQPLVYCIKALVS